MKRDRVERVERVERVVRASHEEFPGTPVLFAYLFGSVATGRDRPDSDADVAVYLDPDVPEERHLDLPLHLGVRLEQAANAVEIDLVIVNTAPIALLGRILRDRVVLNSGD